MRRVTYFFLLALAMLRQPAWGDGVAVTLTVYDLADLDPITMIETERAAAHIFAAAGIDLAWTKGSFDDSQNLMTDASFSPNSHCGLSGGPAAARVAILRQAPPGFSPQALGYSLPCARRGLQVLLYLDRMEKVSNQTAVALSSVVAYSLVHELGHVLLGSAAHASTGLMKGVWTRNDWRLAGDRMIFFTQVEGRRMAELLSQQAVPVNLSSALPSPKTSEYYLER